MKYLITLIVLGAALRANAQTEQGSWMIGGSMSVKRTALDYRISYGPLPGNSVIATGHIGTFSLNPTVGIFAIKNLMIGAQVNYTYNWTFHSDFHSHTLGIGPLVRYYVPFGKFAVFPEVGYSFSGYKEKTVDYDGQPATNRIKSDILHGGVGATWFVTSNIGIEAILGYQKTDVRKTDSDGTRILYFNFGIQFYLPKK